MASPIQSAAAVGTVILSVVQWSGPGQAAEPSAVVKALTGTCLLNRGESIETARPGQLFPGDTVICTEGSEATIVYRNDCVVQMPEESQLIIGAGDEACEALAGALLLPGAVAAASVNVPALIAGYSVVPTVAVIDTIITNNSESGISGE